MHHRVASRGIPLPLLKTRAAGAVRVWKGLAGLCIQSSYMEEVALVQNGCRDATLLTSLRAGTASKLILGGWSGLCNELHHLAVRLLFVPMLPLVAMLFSYWFYYFLFGVPTFVLGGCRRSAWCLLRYLQQGKPSEGSF
eukprot:3350517-Pleurochrysis_carterae.AAC.2